MSPPTRTRRRTFLRWLPALLAAAGLVLAAVLVGRAGLADLAEAVGRVGWGGFVLYALVQIGLFCLLGLAWSVLVPLRRPGLFIWGRMVRDATGQLLPFSPIGGFVLGARAVSLHGIAFPLAAASTFADVTAEFLAQVSFALLGVLVLVRTLPESGVVVPAGIGIVAAALLAAGALLAQRGLGGIFRFLAGRIAAPWFAGITGQAERLQAEIDAIYRQPARLVLSFALHVACWLVTAGASWLAFRLVGAPVSVGAALAIEALLHAVLTAGFIVPGSIGVQELAYSGLGALFGVPPELALAVSLLRRARDLALWVPILLIWQLVESRRAVAQSRAKA